MKYIVELDENMVHTIYFKRWWFSKRKLIGIVEYGGMVAVKDNVISPHYFKNFVRYDFVNSKIPEYNKEKLAF